MIPEHAVPDSHELLEHAEFLRGIARRLLRDEHGVDDVVQQAYVVAMGRSDIRGTRLRGWLGGVVRNLVRMTYRQRHRASAHQRRLVTSGPAPAAADVVARMEIAQILVREVAELDEKYRTVVVLRYFDGFSPHEIAARLGVPGATVRTRLRRGLGILRRRLDRAHDGEPRAWALSLLPLAWPRHESRSTAGSTIGVILVKKVALVLAVLLLLVLGVAILWPGGATDGPGEGTAARPGASAVDHAEAPVAATLDAMSRAPGAPRGPSRQTEATPPDDVALIVVRAADGRPIPGATVELLRDGVDRIPIQRPEVLEARTCDENGQVRFSVVPRREYHLRVSHPDLCTAGDRVCFGGERTEYVLTGGGRLAGYVLDARTGDPVVGATVLVFDWGTVGALCEWSVSTDERGHYRIAGIGPGKVNVRIWGPEHAMLVPRSFPEIVAAAETRADFEIERGIRLALRVVDETTKALLPGVTVWHSVERVARGEGGDLLTAPLPRGLLPVALVFRAPGYLDAFREIRVDRVRRPGDPIEISMGRGLPARGRLLGGGGKPLSGVRLVVASMGPGSRGHTYREGRTDRDGEFEVVGVHPDGVAQLRVDLPRAGWTWSDAIPVPPDAEEARFPTLVAEPDLAVTGRILDPDGRPVTFARLHARPVDEKSLTVTGLTDREGRFCLWGLRPGRVGIVLWRSTGWANRHLTVDAAESVEITWRLERGFDIAGRAERTDGTPVTGVAVQVRAPDSSYMGVCALDGEGRFRVKGLPTGSYRVEVATRPESRLESVAAGTEDLRLVVDG